MKITETKIKVSDLVENYKDNGDGGVFGYNNRLTIRPSFQREFIYGEKQRAAVIDSVMNGFPLNVMYWSKTGADTYEVLDGQQRTVSIAQYINKDFPIKINGNDKFFQNLTNEEKQAILDYELTVYICEGTEAEKLEWFKRINIAGEVLTPQELLEAYTAKERSALDCAEEMADVMEVLYAMGNTCAISKREVEQVRSQKAAEKGTFSKKIFLVSTEK